MMPARAANCVPILMQAAELGLKISVKDSRTLTVKPVDRCPPEFAETLRAHKWHLLCLLSTSFVMVYSEALGETIFFAEDEDTKETLIEAGADSFAIYTRDELRILCEANRIAPLTRAELATLNAIKRTFRGTIVD
jgi:hypothetical protein